MLLKMFKKITTGLFQRELISMQSIFDSFSLDYIEHVFIANRCGLNCGNIGWWKKSHRFERKLANNL